MSSPNDMNDNESTSTFTGSSKGANSNRQQNIAGNDNESTLTFTGSSEGANSNRQQNIAGRPFNPVWNHFNQIEKKKGGHYSANCKYCSQQWARGDLMTFKIHIAHDYILKYVENQELSSKRQEQLADGMCLAFICVGVPFNVASNKIFRAWLQDLRPGFNIPNNKTLAGTIFNKQMIQVEAKIENESSPLANSMLENEIQINNIVVAFIRILEHNSDVISNNEVYMILNRGSFYDDLHFMTSILRPIKESIIQLEKDVLAITDEIGELDDDNSDEDSDNYDYDGVEFKTLDELLVLEESFDLNHEIFREEGQNNNIESDLENEVVEEQPNYDYDVNSLVDE
ncbi:647_t:CDS:2, partial [Gigaspora rosea]